MLLLTSICCSCELELYAVIIYYILDVLHVKYRQKVALLYNFNVAIKFSLLFLNFEVVGGTGLPTGLLIGQLTIVVRIAHFIIKFRVVI